MSVNEKLGSSGKGAGCKEELFDNIIKTTLLNILRSQAYLGIYKSWFIFFFVEPDLRMLDDALLTNLWARVKRSESFGGIHFNQVVF